MPQPRAVPTSHTQWVWPTPLLREACTSAGLDATVRFAMLEPFIGRRPASSAHLTAGGPGRGT